jgi:uncharacterized protein Yka (UPF0111/DUF47 family)
MIVAARRAAYAIWTGALPARFITHLEKDPPMRLATHPERFFEAFTGLAGRVSRCAALLKELLEDPGHADEVLAQMAELNQEAAALRRQVLTDGAAVAVTPLPREDVHHVASLLCDLVSRLYDAAGRMQSLHLDTPREPAARLADVLVRAARCMEASVAGFRRRDFISARCHDMEPLAHEGQDIYDHAIEELFDGAPDPLEVMRWKEVYDVLEHALEHCQEVENALSSIVLANKG